MTPAPLPRRAHTPMLWAAWILAAMLALYLWMHPSPAARAAAVFVALGLAVSLWMARSAAVAARRP